MFRGREFSIQTSTLVVDGSSPCGRGGRASGVPRVEGLSHLRVPPIAPRVDSAKYILTRLWVLIGEDRCTNQKPDRPLGTRMEEEWKMPPCKYKYG